MHHVWWLPILRVPNVQVCPSKTSFVLVHLTDVTPDVSPKGCCCGRLWLCWITPVSTCYIWMDDTVIWQEKKHLQLCSIVVTLWGCKNIMRFTRCLATPRPFSQKCCPIFSSIGQWSLQQLVAYFAYHRGTLSNTAIFKVDGLVKHQFFIIFHVMIWSHPTETTTLKWMFRLPGCCCTWDDKAPPTASELNWLVMKCRQNISAMYKKGLIFWRD